MNIVVLGAGAMGSLFGGRLANAGENVELVDVWEAHVDAIRRDGLRIAHDDHSDVIRVSACLPGELATVPDLVLLMTKSFHTRDALSGIRTKLSKDPLVLTLQNGIGHVDVIQAFVPRARILHGITTYPCDIVGPGSVRTKGEGVVKIGSVASASPDPADDIARIFRKAGFRCEATPAVETAIWEKLAFNAAMNATAAVLRLPVGPIGDSAEGRRLARDVVAEVAAVAARKGIPVSTGRVEGLLSMAFQEHRSHAPSMLQDILAGKRTEIDAINGAVLREAERLGAAVPVNQTLYRLVKTLEHGGS